MQSPGGTTIICPGFGFFCWLASFAGLLLAAFFAVPLLHASPHGHRCTGCLLPLFVGMQRLQLQKGLIQDEFGTLPEQLLTKLLALKPLKQLKQGLVIIVTHILPTATLKNTTNSYHSFLSCRYFNHSLIDKPLY